MSMLWRSSITTEAMFKQVKLGLWENKLRDMLWRNDPGTKHDFSVTLRRDVGEFRELMVNPKNFKSQDGINYVRFKIPLYHFVIKTDQRQFSSELHQFILSPNQEFPIQLKEYDKSKEYHGIQKSHQKYISVES